MKKVSVVAVIFFTNLFICLNSAYSQSTIDLNNLKIVFIRHGEKPVKGGNLTCQGFNRSLQLPAVITAKFGVPDYLFVPAIGLGEISKHSRMFETLVPLAVKYNLEINTVHAEKDSAQLALDLKSKKGTILVAWEHKAIISLVRSLGVKTNLYWPDDDFDSIWIITFTNGTPKITIDKENIHPSASCNF